MNFDMDSVKATRDAIRELEADSDGCGFALLVGAAFLLIALFTLGYLFL